MERILVDLPESHVAELGAIAAVENVSRAEIIRKAIAAYVELNRPSTSVAFAIWKGRGQEGGVEYQERMRSEW